MYQPWSTMHMPHVVPVHYHPYYSQPTSFPVPPVVPPVAPTMSPFAPPASPFVPPMSPFAPAKPPSLLEQFKTKEGDVRYYKNDEYHGASGASDESNDWYCKRINANV